MSSLTDWKKLHGSAFNGTRVMITGGAGFIGSHLAEALSSLGSSVVVIDDLCGGSRENLRGFANVEFVQASVLNVEAVRDRMRDCRYVFHQAALGSVPGSIDQPREYCDVNITGTMNILEAAKDSGVQRVMFAASAAAYGASEELPKVETMPTDSVSPYAATKVAGEALLRSFAASFPLDTASLRYFNIFGPRQNANSAYAAVIAAFASAVLAGKTPQIFGDGEQSRDFTFVDNVVHANLLAAKSKERLNGDIFNIACGQRISVNTLAKTVLEHFGMSDVEPIHRPERAGDVKHSQASISRAKAKLGYTPIVDFKTGLRETLEWYRATSSASRPQTPVAAS